MSNSKNLNNKNRISKKNKSQNKKITKKGGASNLRKPSGLSKHDNNTYATWTMSLDDLSSLKKNFSKKFGNTVLGLIVDTNGILGVFTIEMLQEELKKSYTKLSFKDLDLGGGDQAKLLKADEKVISSLKKFKGKNFGPMLTGGRFDDRIASCKKLLSKIGCKHLIALQPNVESYLTFVSISKTLNKKNTSLFAVGSTDGHAGSVNTVDFFGNIGVKGKVSLEKSIDMICTHLNKDKNPNLWLAGSFCFLFLPDKELSIEDKFGKYTDLAQKDLTKPKYSYSYSSDYLIDSLPAVYSKGGKVEKHNHALLVGVLKNCKHISKVIVGSRK